MVGLEGLEPSTFGFPQLQKLLIPLRVGFIDYDILEPNVIATRPQPRQHFSMPKYNISLPPMSTVNSLNKFLD
jgi:hypothetical protein